MTIGIEWRKVRRKYMLRVRPYRKTMTSGRCKRRIAFLKIIRMHITVIMPLDFGKSEKRNGMRWVMESGNVL